MRGLCSCPQESKGLSFESPPPPPLSARVCVCVCVCAWWIVGAAGHQRSCVGVVWQPESQRCSLWVFFGFGVLHGAVFCADHYEPFQLDIVQKVSSLYCPCAHDCLYSAYRQPPPHPRPAGPQVLVQANPNAAPEAPELFFRLPIVPNISPPACVRPPNGSSFMRAWIRMRTVLSFRNEMCLLFGGRPSSVTPPPTHTTSVGIWMGGSKWSVRWWVGQPKSQESQINTPFPPLRQHH